jgi:NAD(P)-dependent dehydrogenase (short-subunit alcohol dehydrogenase family)
MQPENVVVTGASSGVGRAVAVEFARHGARVALLDRGPDGLAGAARDVERAGGRALALPTDVADAGQIEAAAAAAEEAFGPVDIWVNNAMTTVFAEFADVEPDEFRRATEVTYLGAVWGTRSALRRMLPRDRARSSRSAPRSRTEESHSSAPIAGRSTRSRGSSNRSAASFATTARTCT